MPFAEYDDFDALGLADLVRRGEVSPLELVETAIARVETRNGRLNAVIDRLYDRARAQVRQGLPDGPFRGVPFLIKDAVSLAGEKLSFACVFLRNHVAQATHPILECAEAAGLVTVGRTNLSEFGLLPTTEPALYGPANNPWALDRSPGGSSGGSAAAVAARMVPMAHGNDGGGSIRIPAACCGVFGLKPSRGRTPGIAGEIQDGLVSEHCLSRSVRDSAAMLDVWSGNRAGDRWQIAPPERPYAEAVERDPDVLRVGFSTADLAGREAHPDCRKAVRDTAALCEALGHKVEAVTPEIDGEAFYRDFVALWTVMGDFIFKVIRAEVDQQKLPAIAKKALKHPIGFRVGSRVMAAPARKAPFERLTCRIAGMAAKLSPGDLWVGWTNLQQTSYAMGRYFQDHDVFLTPVLGEPPWRTGMVNERAGDEALAEQVLKYAGYTPLSNVTGLPAISVPLYENAAGLPIGLHFVASYGREDLLLSLAGQLERAQPWAGRRPAICG